MNKKSLKEALIYNDELILSDCIITYSGQYEIRFNNNQYAMIYNTFNELWNYYSWYKKYYSDK